MDTTLIRFAREDFLRAGDQVPAILVNILRESGGKPAKDLAGSLDQNQLQKEISVIEKRFALELEGIKLISKKIEDLSGQTIDRVERRTVEAIDLSEKRSREVTDRVERQAEQIAELAKESIAKTLEAGKA